MTIFEYGVQDIIDLATSAISRYKSRGGIVGKEGGYLTIVDAETGQVWIVVRIGTVPADKHHKYMLLSKEKASRTYTRGDMASSQSRDGISLWGGAVRCGNWIISFSGLPEADDEALVLYIAGMMNISMNLGMARDFSDRFSNVLEPDRTESLNRFFQPTYP